MCCRALIHAMTALSPRWLSWQLKWFTAISLKGFQDRPQGNLESCREVWQDVLFCFCLEIMLRNHSEQWWKGRNINLCFKQVALLACVHNHKAANNRDISHTQKLTWAHTHSAGRITLAVYNATHCILSLILQVFEVLELESYCPQPYSLTGLNLHIYICISEKVKLGFLVLPETFSS